MSIKLRGIHLLVGITLSVFFLQEAFTQTWFAAGSRPQDYEMGGNPMVSHGSVNAGFIWSKQSLSKIDGFGTWMTVINPGEFLGKAMRLSAYVRTEDVEPFDPQRSLGWVSLWVRVDGFANQTLSFDNMGLRPITGTTDWQEYEIIVDVPANSMDINFGLLLAGTGRAWVDGLQVEPAQRTWSIQNSGTSEFIHSIKAVDENTVWAGAQNGVFLRTTDAGLNWTSGAVQGADQLIFHSIAGIDQNTAYFLGQDWNGGDGRIYKTSDGGMSWNLQHHDTRPGTFLNSIAFWDQNNGIAVGDPVDESFVDPVNSSFVILTTTNGGADWNQVPAANIPAPFPGEYGGITGEGGTCLAVQGTGNAWFGTGNASPVRVLRSTDRGQTWTAVNTPISTAGDFHGIQTIAFKDSLTGFAGGVDYPYSDSVTTLVKTTDGGQSWDGVSSFLPIYPSTLVYVPHTNNSALFVSSGQGSGYSEDGGTTWTRLSTVPCYPASFAGPTAGWTAGFRTGRVLRFVPDPATSVSEATQARPERFQLLQNYPNPFNPSTQIRYALTEESHVTLAVYNVLGEEVARLVDDDQPAGYHEISWNASGFASGLYFYRMEAHGNTRTAFVEARKMLLVK